MRITPFQAMFPNPDLITSNDSFFGTIREEFPDCRKSGFFIKEAQESVFIYQIEGAGRTFTGIIACADLEEYIKGKIKKHEKTLAYKEQGQLQLLMRRKAIIKPILLTYHPVAAINEFIEDFLKRNKPVRSFYFESKKVTHKFFEISDGDQLEKLQKLFSKKVPFAYIADGHHRCSTNALLYKRMKKKKAGEDYRNLLCAFFPSDELEICDFNRIVEGLKDVSLTKFMVGLSKVFDIEFLENGRKPLVKHELTIFVNNEWYSLKWKKEILKKYKNNKVVLDANLLDEHILKPIFGIIDVRIDTRIKYVEGVKPLADIVTKTNKDKGLVAFCIYPVRMQELLLVADQNRVMPPKSTWFEPRMKNGLISQDFKQLKKHSS